MKSLPIPCRRRNFLSIVAALALTLALTWGPAAGAAEIERINRTTFAAGESQPGVAPDFELPADLSADGRYLVFATKATAVVPGQLDLNGGYDVFLEDLQLGSVTLLSGASGSARQTGDDDSDLPRIAADGRFAVFFSFARDLTPLSSGQLYRKLFRYDLEQGIASLVSHQAGAKGVALDAATEVEISADGRYVVFSSFDDGNLFVPGLVDADGEDLFLWDGDTDTFRVITHLAGDPGTTATSGLGGDPVFMSADGRFIAFRSSSPDLTPFDAGSTSDAFIYDRDNDLNLMANRPDGLPTTNANAGVLDICGLTPDGRFLLFTSSASNLITGLTDANNGVDLFLFDRETPAIEIVSRIPGPSLASANRSSQCGWMSADGRFVYFRSSASNLVTGVSDAPSSPDLFLRDRQLGATRLVSRAWWAPELAAEATVADRAFVAADGRRFTFSSDSGNLVEASPIGEWRWSFTYDLDLDRIAPSLTVPGQPTVMAAAEVVAADGDLAAAVYTSELATLLTGGAGIERDGKVMVVKREGHPAALAAPAAFAGSGSPGIGMGSGQAMVAGDGSKVVFRTESREICGATSTATCLYDRATRGFTNINHHYLDPQTPLTDLMEPLALSGQDGRYVLAQSKSPLLSPSDANNTWDLVLYDTEERSFELVSRRSGAAGAGNASSVQEVWAAHDAVTLEGDQVAFESLATDLVAGQADANLVTDIFLRDRASAATHLVSRQAGQSATAANGESELARVALLGGYVAFISAATDLVAGFVDGNGTAKWDLFLFDAATGVVTLVSRAAASAVESGNGGARFQEFRVSADGRFVAHQSPGSNLIAGGTDTNATTDVFLFDRATGTNTLVSRSLASPLTAANRGAQLSGISSDGRFLLLYSSSSDLVPGITGTVSQVYLWDRVDGSFRLVSHRQGEPAVTFAAPSTAKLSPDAGRVVLSTTSANVIPGVVDTNGKSDIFVWERATGNIELLTAKTGESMRTNSGRCEFFSFAKAILDDGRGVLFSCEAADVMTHDSNYGSDLFLALLPEPFFGDGFESGSTGAWSAAVP